MVPHAAICVLGWVTLMRMPLPSRAMRAVTTQHRASVSPTNDDDDVMVVVAARERWRHQPSYTSEESPGAN